MSHLSNFSVALANLKMISLLEINSFKALMRRKNIIQKANIGNIVVITDKKNTKVLFQILKNLTN